MKKEKFVSPEIEIIYLDRKDIITESDPNEEIEVR